MMAAAKPGEQSYTDAVAVRNSFDHLVGASEQGWGNVKADRVCGLEIDHQFEPGRLLDRKIARVCTAHDLVDVRC